MMTRTAIAGIVAVLICTAEAASQARQTQRPTGRVARSGPAYLQKLKAFEDSNLGTRAVLRNNGLTVLVHEYRAQPTVCVTICQRAGYGDPEGKSGAAELAAALFFRATRTRSAEALARDLQSIGARTQSRVDFDRTLHDLSAPAVHWKKALELQADALLNPVADDESTRAAIGRVRFDLQSESGRPDTLVRNDLVALAFAGRPPGRDLPSLVSDLGTLDTSRVANFRMAAHSLSRSMMVVTGDVVATEVLAEAVRLLDSPARPSGKDQKPDVLSPDSSFQFAQKTIPLARANVLFGFAVPGADSPRAPAVEVLSSLLGRGEGSVVGRRLRGEKDVILSGSSGCIDFRQTGFLWLQLSVEAGAIDRAQIALLTEIELLRRANPDEYDVQRAVAQLEREYWSAMQTAQSRSHGLVRFEQIGDWKRLFQSVARLRKVTAADVSAAARDFLRLDRCALLEALPRGGEARPVTRESALKTLGSLLEVSTTQEAATRERETVFALKWMPASDNFKPSEIRYPRRLGSILRGPDMFVLEDHTTPLVQMGLYFKGGPSLESATNAGISALTILAMLRGPAKTKSAEIYRQIEILGGTIRPVVQPDYFGLELEAPSRHIQPCLQVVSDIVKNPGLDDEVVLGEKRRLLAAVEGMHLDAGRRLLQLGAAQLFRDHFYALPTWGEPGAIGELGPDAVREWHRLQIANKRPVVVIAGDTQGTGLSDFFVRNFSGSRMGEGKLPDAFPEALEQARRIEEASPDGRSRTLLAFLAPPDGDDDAAASRVLAAYLGAIQDLLGSNASREGAARVEVAYRPLARGGWFTFSVSGSEEGEGAITAALTDRLRKVNEAPVLYRDYRIAVQSASAALHFEQEDRFRQMRVLVRRVVAGGGLQAFEEALPRIQEVQPEDLPELSRRLFAPGRAVTARLSGAN